MFKATREQSLAKARLHKKISNNPMIGSAEELSIRKMEQFSEVKDLSDWMEKPGFKEWFLNDHYIEDLMEADLELGMDRLRELLSLPMDGEKGNPKPGEMVKAVEMLLKYTGREPKKQAPVVQKESDIDSMDEAQLDKYISQTMGDKKLKAVSGE